MQTFFAVAIFKFIVFRKCSHEASGSNIQMVLVFLAPHKFTPSLYQHYWSGKLGRTDGLWCTVVLCMCSARENCRLMSAKTKSADIHTRNVVLFFRRTELFSEALRRCQLYWNISLRIILVRILKFHFLVCRRKGVSWKVLWKWSIKEVWSKMKQIRSGEMKLEDIYFSSVGAGTFEWKGLGRMLLWRKRKQFFYGGRVSLERSKCRWSVTCITLRVCWAHPECKVLPLYMNEIVLLKEIMLYYCSF
jgi:hypothetical protein